MTVIRDLATLDALYDAPSTPSLRKVAKALTPEYQQMLEAAPFCALATSGPGGLDVSPRGDPAPLLRVEDAQTILLPDRRGNNRLDSLRNILEDPRVGLLFLIPGRQETLRINGSAELDTAPELLAGFEMDGKPPKCVIRIRIAEVYFQCARAIIRAGLWDKARTDLPSAGEMARGAFPEFDAESYDAALPARQKVTLY